jgi:hypothetical protein
MKILGFSVISAIFAVSVAAMIVMVTSTPVVYYSHKTFVKTGRMQCVFVLTNKGEEPCSVIEKEKITRHESDWAE